MNTVIIDHNFRSDLPPLERNGSHNVPSIHCSTIDCTVAAPKL